MAAAGPLSPLDRRIGGWFAARFVMGGAIVFFAFWLTLMPSTPAQAALAAFLFAAMVWLRLTGHPKLETIRIERTHRPRVFEGDALPVTLRLSLDQGLPVQMLQIEDMLEASLEVRRRHLAPLLAPGWELMIHTRMRAERHRGIYLMGPVRLWAGDGLGVFFSQCEAPCLTRLTVYPQADPLPQYTIPGPAAEPGPSLDAVDRVGQAEQLTGVREYHPGDPVSRIHWRTSARRGRLHVIQRNRAIQSELAVMLDLTRRSRLGLGGETTTELAIGAAVSILTRAHEMRHRLSLTYVRDDVTHFPPGSGLGHLHLLLDRLAVINAGGEGDFWGSIGDCAQRIKPGSRIVVIAPLLTMDPERTAPLIGRIAAGGVAVDMVLIDDGDYIRIHTDQEIDLRERASSVEQWTELFMRCGARVWPLGRGASHLPAQPRQIDPSR
jgi:uncharacterized protein (DUF58 family)